MIFDLHQMFLAISLPIIYGTFILFVLCQRRLLIGSASTAKPSYSQKMVIKCYFYLGNLHTAQDCARASPASIGFINNLFQAKIYSEILMKNLKI